MLRYENNTWTSQYEVMKNLRKAINDLDLNSKKREPKIAQAKFPPFFQKPKSKLKKFAFNVSVPESCFFFFYR